MASSIKQAQKNQAMRMQPLEDRLFASNGISLFPTPAAWRISLRVRADGMAAAKKAIGFALPTKPKSSVSKNGVSCLWIGPDEWLIIDEGKSNVWENLQKLGNTKLSAVDVSHRNTGIMISGDKAVNAINSGCPQDLSDKVFPVGAASRTMLGKAEIVLFRTGKNEYRVEVWRSFSDYAWNYLVDAVKAA